jgi:hypothetical protein
MSTRDDLVSQVITMRKKFPSYKAYGYATMQDVWSAKDQQDAVKLKATEMRTSYIENLGNGKFKMTSLPLEAQMAPVFGMVCEDADGDGNPDLLLVGNDYGMDPFSGRHDAFSGLCLKGDGKGGFTPLSVSKSGFFINGDAKGLATIRTAKNEDIIVATQNQDSLLVFNKRGAERNSTNKWIPLKTNDMAAEVLFKNGTKRKLEFYYGSTFLSQSSRGFYVDDTMQQVTITNFKGIKRRVL